MFLGVVRTQGLILTYISDHSPSPRPGYPSPGVFGLRHCDGESPEEQELPSVPDRDILQDNRPDAQGRCRGDADCGGRQRSSGERTIDIEAKDTIFSVIYSQK